MDQTAPEPEGPPQTTGPDTPPTGQGTAQDIPTDTPEPVNHAPQNPQDPSPVPSPHDRSPYRFGQRPKSIWDVPRDQRQDCNPVLLKGYGAGYHMAPPHEYPNAYTKSAVRASMRDSLAALVDLVAENIQKGEHRKWRILEVMRAVDILAKYSLGESVGELSTDTVARAAIEVVRELYGSEAALEFIPRFKQRLGDYA